jgi:hypothetical protein
MLTLPTAEVLENAEQAALLEQPNSVALPTGWGPAAPEPFVALTV